MSRDLVEVARRTIRRRGLFKGGERCVVAVSGGADSLALLHVLVALRPEHDLDLHVAHFDHRLRPDSGADAALVARVAEGLGLPVTVRAAEQTDRPPGRSPEEIARERRLRFLEGLAEELGAARVATGHTLDDQAETVLMRLLTGTGPRGLSGIPPLRWWMVRPLIDARRAETEAYCAALGLEPAADPTNEDTGLLRGAMRHEVIPWLRERVNDRLPEALARLADVMRDENAVMHGRMMSESGHDLDGPDPRMPLASLEALPVALRRRAVRYLCAVRGVEIDHERTEAVLDVAARGATGAVAEVPGGFQARVEYGWLVIGRAPSPEAAGAVTLEGPGETDLPGWSRRARCWVTGVRPHGWPADGWTCVLDADRAPFPLRIRSRRTGDSIRPLGMEGEKTVSDLFSDLKVPRAARDSVPIVEAASGAVVWVAGHRIDDRAKVTGATTRFLWLSLEGSGS